MKQRQYCNKFNKEFKNDSHQTNLKKKGLLSKLHKEPLKRNHKKTKTYLKNKLRPQQASHQRKYTDDKLAYQKLHIVVIRETQIKTK